MTNSHAIIVVDLAFGDCGKGTFVDFLARRHNAHAVVRFNGGPQAAHNVITADGLHHTFAHFGSATFCPGVRTVLSRFVLIEPYALLNEAGHLDQLGVGDAIDRLLIDARCPVITPAHQAANRLVEFSRGAAAHGTCGMGIGETMQDLIDHPHLMLHASDLHDRTSVMKKLAAIREMKLDRLRDVLSAARSHPKARKSADTLLDPSWMDVAADNYAALAGRAHIAPQRDIQSVLCAPGTVIFEGAQGVLLDEWFGFHPHTTWSTTTFANAQTLLDESGHDGRRTRVGVLRTYFTRHGAGPLVTEDPALGPLLPEPHNNDRGWAGRFRVGPLDAVAARYALGVAGPVDMLAISHLDCLPQLPRRICTAYSVDPLTPTPDIQNAADEFAWERGNIIAIKPRRPADFTIAERRTEILRRCGPIYSPAPANDAGKFLEMIGGELRTPVGMVSRGPKADEKEML